MDLGSIVALKSFKNYFFSAGEDGNICVWKMKEWVLMHKFQAHKRPIIDFALHSSGKMLISISKDRKMHIWNLLNFTKSFSRKFSYGNLKINLSFITHHKDLFKILFNHNEDSLILQSEKAIHILSFSTNKMLAVLEHPSKLQDFVLYKENFLISGDDQGYIFFWDLTTNHHIKFKAHQNRIKSIKLVLSSSDLADSMDFLVTCSSDGKICFWDTLYLLGELKIIEEDKDLGTDIRNVICIESRQRINCLEIVQKVEENQEEKAEIKKDIEVVKKKIKKLKKKGKKINNKNKKLEI